MKHRIEHSTLEQFEAEPIEYLIEHEQFVSLKNCARDNFTTVSQMRNCWQLTFECLAEDKENGKWKFLDMVMSMQKFSFFKSKD